MLCYEPQLLLCILSLLLELHLAVCMGKMHLAGGANEKSLTMSVALVKLSL